MQRSRSRAMADVSQALRRNAGLFRGLQRKVLSGRLSPANAAVLEFIAEHQMATPSQIAQFTGLTAGSITTLLDGLEREGYIARNRSAEDRRVVLVQLTSRAAEVLTQLLREAQAEMERLFQSWSVDEISTFTSLLERLGDVVEKEVHA